MWRGYAPVFGLWEYLAVTDEGNTFCMNEAQYLGPTGTRIKLPDDMCTFDSGWVKWGCGKCGWPFWTRTRPGGKVSCPACSNEELCPEWVKVLPFEGADDEDLHDEDAG